MRKKYRIRIYNYSAESIKLERKKKFGSYIYKEDAPLTKDEVQKILSGEYEFLLKSPYNLCREFYIECMSNMMRPRTIVDYEREPWIMDEEQSGLHLIQMSERLLEAMTFSTVRFRLYLYWNREN